MLEPAERRIAKILLVEDHEIMREGVRLLIGREPDLQVVGEAADARTALELTGRLHPDLVVLDLGLPDAHGTDLARRILEHQPSARLIILSAQGDPDLLKEALEAGVSGYVLKANSSDELVRALRAVAAGRMYLCPELCSTMLTGYKRLLETPNRPSPGDLSERERGVLRLLSEGRTTKEIADELGLSTKTIETHRLRIMEKLGVHSVAELTKHAIRLGLTSV
ncbi:MAG: response regulator transcription factor [Verrucomicrobia bacterium]|nr:response regulator transcription factor [Verrucomicrobiota bacterium]